MPFTAVYRCIRRDTLPVVALESFPVGDGNSETVELQDGMVLEMAARCECISRDCLRIVIVLVKSDFMMGTAA